MPLLPAGAQTDPHRFVREFPDIEIVVGQYLRDMITTEGNVYTELPPSPDWSKPVIRCLRIGGTWRVPGIIDEPIVDLDIWAKTTNSAKAMTAKVRGYCAALKGVKHKSLLITKVSESAGPVRRPETDETLSRLGFTIGLTIQPMA